MENKPKTYANPYLMGFLLGLVLLIAFYISGRGLGASGAMKSSIVALVDAVAPEHAADNAFFSTKLKGEKSPLKAWLVFEVIGVLLGGFVSGLVSKRLKFKLEHGPKIKPGSRVFWALMGGILFGVGAQLGRGCTSGAALSGMATLSSAGFVSMMAIFGTAFVAAFIFKRLWT